VQDKSSYKNYKREIKDLKLRFITGRSQRQVPIFQWQGIGPARTGRSAAPAGGSGVVSGTTVRALVPGRFGQKY